MTIITQTDQGPQTDFEYDYIYNFLLYNAEKYCQNKRIIVYSSNRRDKLPVDVKPDDILIHLSNENLKYNYHFLQKSNVVLRSYYHPFVLKKNCYTIPLGWQTGLGNHESYKGRHDKYLWCFIGQIKGYRRLMFDVFKNVEHGYASVSKDWNSRRLTNEDVRQIYLNTAFALVPFGSIHADTMRPMEVMEHGCIPVVVKYLRSDYYRLVYGNHPFIVGEDWEDARGKVIELWNDKSAMQKKREEVEAWYANFKRNLQDDITDIILGRKPTRGEQWKYQCKGHFNIKILLFWYYHFYYKKQPLY